MNTIEIDLKNIESKIYLIRGCKVMFDEDLAELYQVTTKRLNQQMQRNLKRLSQIATSSERHGGRRYLPIAFTEQGIAMNKKSAQSIN